MAAAVVLVAGPGARSLAAQAAEPVSAAEAELWRADLAQFEHELVAGHGDVFHTLPRTEFASMVAALRERIPQLPRHQIIIEFQRIAAAIGDGHTTVALFFDPDVGFHRLPVRLGWYEEGIFAEWVRDGAGVPAGARLVAIGGVGIDEAVRRVTPLISRDNDIWIRAMAPLLLASPEVLHALELSDDPGAAVLTVEVEGTIREIALRAEPEPFSIAHGPGAPMPAGWTEARRAGAETPIWRRNPGQPYWYEYLPEEKVLYIQYNQVNDAPEGPGVHEFFATALAVLDAEPVERVAVDIRVNGGGEGGLNNGVVRQFVQRKELDRPGALLVIIGRQTFSAAQELAHKFDQWTDAVFVGEPTGSSPQFWGDHQWFELGNSGIAASSSPTWWQPGGPYDRRRFLPPLLAFEPRFEDSVNGRDPVMDAVLDWDGQELSIANALLPALAADDSAAAVAAVRAWSANPVHRFVPATTELNRLGYALVADHRMDTALEVLRLNVQVHPDYANGWDSLGDVLFRAGRHPEGLEAYRRAYELDPEVGRAAQVLSGREPQH